MYGTSRNLREENVTTHQERLENDLKKGMQRIRNVFFKLFEEHTIYQERPARYSTKSLQRIRNVFKVV